MEEGPVVRRRALLGIVAGSATGAVAGCSSDTTETAAPPAETDVVVGPNDALVFDPERFTVQVGESVTWFFQSPGHNVSCRPADSQTVELPAEAAVFASYGPQESPQMTVPQGAMFTHTFDVPGEYVYVCIPHVTYDMVGTIHVQS